MLHVVKVSINITGVAPSFHFCIMGASLMSKHSACARVLHAGILIVEVLRDRRLNSRRILGVVARGQGLVSRG